MPASQASATRSRSARAGFSLVELMITLVLLAVVVAVIATVMISSQRSKADTEGRLEAQQSGRAISDIIAADIRTAGYGADNNSSPNQPAFAYVDSVEIMLNVNQTPFPDSSVTLGYPQAINPAATPMPHKLTGSYLPPMTYTTGAETIVYTLDLNNDGVVDASDQSQAMATEASRTANPNDYVVGRAVYGLQSAGGGNGGSIQKVGLIRGPGAGIPAMYTVYLNGSATPWDWHSGPVPANRLKDITSVKLQITTEGRRPRSDGTYPRSTLTTEINSIRNVPNIITSKMYHVTGYVFRDMGSTPNLVKDVGEPGIPGVVVRLGNVSVAQTSSTGFYDVYGPQAQYLLKQSVPAGYGAEAPDSFQVDFLANANDQVHDFADTARTGAWVSDTCYVDLNANLTLDAADTRVDGATMGSSGNSCKTGADGGAAIFLTPGMQTISFAPPDSYMVVSTNPVTTTVTNGVPVVLYTRLIPQGTGTVTGTVYLDTNKNSTKDTGEGGIQGAWVGVTADAGVTILGYGYTDASGNYSIVVPNNMPAATQPYTVTVVPPDGYYPTGTTAISPVWVTMNAVTPNENFGLVNFTSFNLFADRVLALGTANLLEFDWSGSASQWASKGSFDEDLILCSEYVSNPNISIWFNRMPTTPVFDSTFTYQVNAQSSALSIATGSIDTSATSPNVVAREDAVTGLAYKASGNIAVWLDQNTSGNEGHFVNSPQLYSSGDGGDVQQVALQDCAGGPALDLIVGTKSPAAFTGTLEVWRGDGTGHFIKDETYPNAGNLPGNRLGEVKAMALGDVTSDGNNDLIVGTRTGDGTGKLHILGFNTKINGNRYRAINSYDVVGEVTSVVLTDMNGDGRMDIVLGTRLTASTGNVQYWMGLGSGSFVLASTFVAPGPVLCLATADLGGTSRKDILYGFRLNESSFAGGVRILYTDLGTLPPDDVDPAGGTSSYMTTSIAAWNFNYRLNSTTPGPYLTDFAVAQKPTATTGRLFVYVR